MKKNKNIIVTGAAGFIGYHLSKRLCNENYYVIGVDNLNDYYETELKSIRVEQLEQHNNFEFAKLDISEKNKLFSLFNANDPHIVINLAAQAGVRYSITNPDAYVESNLVGFVNVLEACRNYPVEHFIYASSSSVYGANKKIPFSESDSVDHPVSLYAATKKSNELLAHTYSHLYNIPTTGLRFFTVYGPMGRPDMAYFKFTKNIIQNIPIDVYNNGNLERDFTYIDDIVESMFRLIHMAPTENKNWNYLKPNPATSFAPYKIFNIGNNKPVKLMNFIEILEELIGKESIKNFLPMQPGDVYTTFADIDNLFNLVKFQPKTSIKEGLYHFVNWYKNHYK